MLTDEQWSALKTAAHDLGREDGYADTAGPTTRRIVAAIFRKTGLNLADFAEEELGWGHAESELMDGYEEGWRVGTTDRGAEAREHLLWSRLGKMDVWMATAKDGRRWGLLHEAEKGWQIGWWENEGGAVHDTDWFPTRDLAVNAAERRAVSAGHKSTGAGR